MSGKDLNHILASFLPAAVSSLDLHDLPSGAVKEGSVLFADVSGFTALSERLQSLGREGAEELTRVLNGYFTEMISILDAYGGDVVKFGGDAMTVLFSGDDGSKATHAAAVMQAAMEPFEALDTRGGVCTLAMKIGIAHGPYQLAVVGGEGRKEPILSGPPVDESADAEHHAEKGWVVLHPSVPVLKNFSGENQGDGYLKIDLSTLPRKVEGQAGEWGDTPKGELGSFLPEGLAESLEHLDADRIGGHRDLVIGFLSFPTLDYVSDPSALDDLQAFTLLLSKHLDQFGGALNKLDMGDKGSKAILLFGAPKALEDPASAALHFGHALFADPDLPESLGNLRLGLNRADVFAGIVGSPDRHEYTVMGDGVNLAARLMQKTEAGQVIASKSVMDGGPTFSGDPLEPFQVKGKSEPIYAFLNPRPERRQGKRKAAHPWPDWVARPKVLDNLKTFLEQQGPGALAHLSAPEGGGKSFLLQTAQQQLSPALRKRTVEVALSPFHGNLAWSGLVPLAQHLGLGSRKNGQEKYGDLACLLNPFLLGEPLEETEAAKVMDPQARSQWLQATLVEVMGEQDWCCLVDGGQWLDELSRQTLNLWRKGSPEKGRVVLAVRSSEDLPAADQEFILPAWDTDVVTDLLTTHPPADRLDEPVAGQIVELTAGNPLSVTTLLTLCEEQDLWRYDVASDRTILKEDEARELMGEGLGNLVLARFDALPADLRKFLQFAAVVGSAFRSRVLQALAGEGSVELTDQALAAGWMTQQEGRYDLAFASESVHRALYDALTFAFKREAHDRVARYLLGEDPSAMGAIASHFLMADAEEASPWLVKAAEQAEERYERHAAKRYLTQAIERMTEQAKPEEQQVLLESAFRRGMIATETGDVPLAEQDFFSLLEAPDCPEDIATKSARELGYCLLRSGKKDQAAPLLKQAFERAEKLSDREILHSCAAAVITFYGMTGDSENGMSFANQFLTSNPDACLATMNRGNIYQFLGEKEKAQSDFEMALKSAKKEGNLLWQAMAMISLGGNAFDLGKISNAFLYLREGISIYQKLYKVQALAGAEANLGKALYLAGLFHQGSEPLQHATRITTLFGSPYQTYFVVSNFRDILLEMGEPTRAKAYIDQTIQIAKELQAPGMDWDSWWGTLHYSALVEPNSFAGCLKDHPTGSPPQDIADSILFLCALLDADTKFLSSDFFAASSDLAGFFHDGTNNGSEFSDLKGELSSAGRGLDLLRVFMVQKKNYQLHPQDEQAFLDLAKKSGSPLWEKWASS